MQRTSTSVAMDDAEKPYSPLRLRLTGWFSLIALCGLSLVLQGLIFPPLPASFLAYVCFVPWLVAVVAGVHAPRIYWGSYLLGLASFLVNARWISLVTFEGYVALCAYLAVYFPLAACPLRHAVRYWRIPLAVATPVIWVALEYLRALIISGFPWFFLAHTQYRVLPLIQISDLVGAYGVSFVVMSINGLLADIIVRWPGRGLAGALTAARTSLGFTLSLLVVVLGYGVFQLNRNTLSEGPRVAVLQRDYPLLVNPSGDEPREPEKAKAYFDLVSSLDPGKVDIYLFPETPWWMCLNPEFLRLDPSETTLSGAEAQTVLFSRRYNERFRDLAKSKGATIVVGAMYHEKTPLDLRSKDRKHNSAYVFSPSRDEPERYDKIHCVYFGEVVPFRFGRLRPLYFWLNERMPFGADGNEYSIAPGSDFKVFSLVPKSQPDKTYRFGVLICYEDVMPYLARWFANGSDGNKQVDFLLNISNDGWFQHSNELTQHLSICTFRAVENRVGIARAVNTGVSGFIDSDGRIHDLVTKNGVAQGKGIEGARVAPVSVDSRYSLYSRTGDLFATTCTALWGLVYVDYLRVRAIGRRRLEAQSRAEP